LVSKKGLRGNIALKLGLHAVFQKEFTPVTFTKTMWNWNRIK